MDKKAALEKALAIAYEYMEFLYTIPGEEEREMALNEEIKELEKSLKEC